MGDSLLVMSLSQLAVRLPQLIVYGIAIGYAVVRWEKHPQVSALVVTAVALLTLEMLFYIFVGSTIPLRLVRQGGTAASTGRVMAAYAVVSGLVSAGCFGLLVAAVFGWRSRKPGASGQ